MHEITSADLHYKATFTDGTTAIVQPTILDRTTVDQERRKWRLPAVQDDPEITMYLKVFCCLRRLGKVTGDFEDFASRCVDVSPTTHDGHRVRVQDGVLYDMDADTPIGEPDPTRPGI